MHDGSTLNRCIVGMCLLAMGFVMPIEAAELNPASDATITKNLPTEGGTGGVDYPNAKAMPLPSANTLPPPQGQGILHGKNPREIFGNSGFSKGGTGSGVPTHSPAPR
jgi:hypothetical protein